MADMFNRNTARGGASLRAAHQGIGDNLQSLAELRQELDIQRRVLMHLVYRPSCGAQVQDLEGVTNEHCQWCGASLGEDG